MKEVLIRYENLLTQIAIPCIKLLKPGIPIEESLLKLKSQFPSLIIERNFLEFYEWHNGTKDTDNYLNKIIIPDFYILDIEEAINQVESDDIYSWKENQCLPILTVGDEHLCIKAQNGKFDSYESPIIYFATWDYASINPGKQIYDNLLNLFTGNIKALEKGIIYTDEKGNMDIENTMDEYWKLNKKINPNSIYWG